MLLVYMKLMLEARSNMFLVCVTVGLVLLASKYRNNVLRSVKQLCHGIGTNKQNDVVSKKEFKIMLDKIILADSPEKCDYAVQRIRCNLSHGVLGFDCEWVNDGPVCLLQLATCNGVCALFRIGKIGFIPSKLKELLSSRHILKVGVASFEDGQKIVKDYGCQVFGTLDLRTLANRLELPSPKSLAALSLEYLGLEMEKIVEVRCGEWDATTLTDEQVAYAAGDAIASALIYQQIMQCAEQQRSIWQRIKSHLKSYLQSEFHDLPDGIVDIRFRTHRTRTDNESTANKVAKYTKVCNNNDDQFEKQKSSIPARNKPLYHNCYLQAPDGDVLCTCDRKKAEWYVSKGLGEMVDEDPLTVRLKFEPSGRALGDVGQYYTQIKVNQCVVCGSSEKFIRKNVVPREYRKYFPLVMKAHQSHDVLLLCPSCHEISSSYDLQLRRKLAEICNAPLLGPLSHVRDKHTNDRRKVQSAVKALRDKLSLPHQRQRELESYILGYTGQKEFSPALLEAVSMELKKNPIPPRAPATSTCTAWQSHGSKVVQYFEKREGGLIQLERMWREHFLRTMKPRYLPNLWSVCHNQERLAIRQTQNRIEPEDAKAAGLQ